MIGNYEIDIFWISGNENSGRVTLRERWKSVREGSFDAPVE